MEKALEILNAEEKRAYDLTAHLLLVKNNEIYAETLIQLNNAHIKISELEEAMKPKSCESCKHWKVRNKLVRSNECFKWSGSVMTPRDFCCNRYEAKEQ